MMLRRLIPSVLIGAFLSAPLLALMAVANRAVGLPFAPFDFFDWFSRVLPGPVITFGIDSMIGLITALGMNVANVAKSAEQLMAIGMLFGGLTLGATVFQLVWAARGSTPDRLAGLVAGALLGLPLTAISLGIGQSALPASARLVWLVVLYGAWGLALAQAFARWQTADLATETKGAAPDADRVGMADASSGAIGVAAADVERLDRRRFLVRLGAGSATITVLGAGVAQLLSRGASPADGGAAEGSTLGHRVDEAAHLPFPNLNDPVMPAPGTRPEYTPVKDHYKVFLRTEPTVIDGATWMLPVTGAVEEPTTFTLDRLRKDYRAHDQFVTLSCISGNVGTTLISTTQWTGLSLQDLLPDLKLKPEAKYLQIKSGDGFYETVALDLIRAEPRIMLCYDWDGNTLPVDHGFPLRIWIPDHFGMKQPKWITSIEVTADDRPGYWVERQWDKEARVKTTSVIDAVAVDAAYTADGKQVVPVGGIAFSGVRGIGKVEVRVDGGPWQPTRLREPLSESTWVMWRYDWPFAPGPHTFEVHCTEEDGTPQIEAAAPNRPSGATGIHTKKVG